MMTQSCAIEITKLNIHDIFGERDAIKRLDVLADNWVASGESLFVDPLHVCKTHEAISAVIHKFQGFSGPENTFVELSACL